MEATLSLLLTMPTGMAVRNVGGVGPYAGSRLPRVRSTGYSFGDWTDAGGARGFVG